MAGSHTILNIMTDTQEIRAPYLLVPTPGTQHGRFPHNTQYNDRHTRDQSTITASPDPGTLHDRFPHNTQYDDRHTRDQSTIPASLDPGALHGKLPHNTQYNDRHTRDQSTIPASPDPGTLHDRFPHNTQYNDRHTRDQSTITASPDPGTLHGRFPHNTQYNDRHTRDQNTIPASPTMAHPHTMLHTQPMARNTTVPSCISPTQQFIHSIRTRSNQLTSPLVVHMETSPDSTVPVVSSKKRNIRFNIILISFS